MRQVSPRPAKTCPACAAAYSAKEQQEGNSELRFKQCLARHLILAPDSGLLQLLPALHHWLEFEARQVSCVRILRLSPLFTLPPAEATILNRLSSSLQLDMPPDPLHGLQKTQEADQKSTPGLMQLSTSCLFGWFLQSWHLRFKRRVYILIPTSTE